MMGRGGIGYTSGAVYTMAPSPKVIASLAQLADPKSDNFPFRDVSSSNVLLKAMAWMVGASSSWR